MFLPTTLKATSSRGSLAIFQTLPNPDQRIKDIDAYITKHSAKSKNPSEGRLLEELYRNPKSRRE